MKYKRFFLIDDENNDGLFQLQVGGDRSKLFNDVNSRRQVRVVSNTRDNNGVESYIYNDNVGIKNCITLGTRGNDYFSCYQDDYTVTIVRTLLLYTKKFELNKYIAFYICALLRMNKYKCAYGRVLSGERLQLEQISLPVNEDGNPNWIFIENKCKEIYNKIYNSVNQNPLIEVKLQLQTKNWKSFKIGKLFDVVGTKTTPVKILQESGMGEYPYITTKATNNGCDGFYNIKTEYGNVITVDSAVVGYASYQAKDFSASDHVEKLKPNFPLNKFVAMFLITILNREQYRFHYGRKASQERLKTLQIKLPAKTDNNGNLLLDNDNNPTPDWQFMENYIKSLPYSSSL